MRKAPPDVFFKLLKRHSQNKNVDCKINIWARQCLFSKILTTDRFQSWQQVICNEHINNSRCCGFGWESKRKNCQLVQSPIKVMNRFLSLSQLMGTDTERFYLSWLPVLNGLHHIVGNNNNSLFKYPVYHGGTKSRQNTFKSWTW